MKFASLIRDLALIRSPERKDEIARLSNGQLARLPEATIVAVIRGWFELKADGHSDADILREIESRREKEYGEESLPGGLTLESYTRYRLRLEHPGEEKAHDAIFVMQAVHRARQVIGGTCREETEGATARGPRKGATAILAYAAVIAATQGWFAIVLLRAGITDLQGWVAVLGVAAACGMLLGAIGYAGGTVWGRPLLVAFLGAEISVCVVLAVLSLIEGGWDPLVVLPFAAAAAGAFASLAYLRHRRREFATRSLA